MRRTQSILAFLLVAVILIVIAPSGAWAINATEIASIVYELNGETIQVSELIKIGELTDRYDDPSGGLYLAELPDGTILQSVEWKCLTGTRCNIYEYNKVYP